MIVWLNGKKAETQGATTVSELAALYGLTPHTVLIEHNGIALHQRDWRTQMLQADDRLEFIRVVAGG